MTNQLLKSTSIVSLMTCISRVLGFARDMILAQSFGVFSGFDAFLVAFKIPNFMRRLFAEGAFSQAFIPVLADYQANRTQEQTQRFINHIAGCLTGVLLGITVFGMVCSPYFVALFAPGFLVDASRYVLATHWLRITFPYLMLISLAAMVSALLNSNGRFAIPAMTPVWLNVTMIAAVYSAHGFSDEHGLWLLSWSIPIAGVLQLAFQWPFLKKTPWMPRLCWGWSEPGVRRVMRLMLAALVGVSVAQIGSLIDTLFASFLTTGSISWLYFSERLTNFPMGVFGVAIATVILPHLSRYSAQQDWDGFSYSLDWSMRLIVLVGLPATVGLMALAHPLCVTLFQYGKFTPVDAYMASKSLVALALGIPAFMLVKVLAVSFYSRQNMRIPVQVGMVSLGFNVVFNVLWVRSLAHAGLALATALSAYINMFLLLRQLLKTAHYRVQSGWMLFLGRVVGATMVMGLWITWQQVPVAHWVHWPWRMRVAYLAYLITTAVVVYVVSLGFFGLRGRMLRLVDAHHQHG